MGTNSFSVNSELKSESKIKVYNNRGHEITIDDLRKLVVLMKV